MQRISMLRSVILLQRRTAGRLFRLVLFAVMLLQVGGLRAASGRMALQTPGVAGRIPAAYERHMTGRTVRDTVYVYNRSNTPSAALAVSSDTLSTFSWYRMAGAVPSAAPFFVAQNVVSSRVDTLSAGGYLLAMETMLPDTVLRDTSYVWFLCNEPFTFRLEKNTAGRIVRGQQCGFIDFYLDPSSPALKPSSLRYYNPQTLEAFDAEVPVSFTVQAGSGAPGACRLYTEAGGQYLRTADVYAVETRYTFTASDGYGRVQRDEAIALPWAVTADFTLRAATDAAGKYSAPLDVELTNAALNATSYVWNFGDGETLETAQLTHPSHTYRTPKNYTVTLTASNAHGCEATFSQTFAVDASDLRNANVFTPNGDGQNDYFLPYTVSIRRFSIKIYTRSGRLVYSHSGDDMRFWEGWDGKTNEGHEASEGVYYYVMEAKGYGRKQTYEPENYTGFVYLYR
ncbi:MAG: gliding motility-associated C-terminal domain-containing protein [Bacteroidales bacterium]|nr:gliding motility-associated C-terminal domain-containing protein [Bacteroidales bacterium]